MSKHYNKSPQAAQAIPAPIKCNRAILYAGGTGAVSADTMVKLQTALLRCSTPAKAPTLAAELDLILSFMDEKQRNVAQFKDYVSHLTVLSALNKASYCLPKPNLILFNAIDAVQKTISENGSNSTIIQLCPAAQQDLINGTLTAEEQLADPRGGTFQSSVSGDFYSSLFSDALLDQSFQNKIAQLYQGTSFYVSMLASPNGGEGRSTIMCMVKRLRRAVVEEGKRNQQTDQSIQSALDKLHISVILVSGIAIPPRTSTSTDKLNDNFQQLGPAVTALMAEELEHDIDLLVYLAPRSWQTLSHKRTASGDQKWHSHLLFLLAAAWSVRWCNGQIPLTAGRDAAGRLMVVTDPFCVDRAPDPNAAPNTDPQPDSWDDLNLPAGWRNAMVSELRFAVVFLLSIVPQLDLPSDKLRTSPYLGRIFTKEQIRGMDPDQLENEVRKPIQMLAAQAKEFLQWCYELSISGTDWSKGTPNGAEGWIHVPDFTKTDILNSGLLQQVLDWVDQPHLVNPSQLFLDDLSATQHNGNPAKTGLTLDHAYTAPLSKARTGILGFGGIKPPEDLFLALDAVYETVRI